MTRDRVVVVGSGLMGSGIAARSILGGNKTILVDTSEAALQKGAGRVMECLQELEENGLTDGRSSREKWERLLSCTTDRETALRSARLVIEAVYENLELKQALFEEMDRLLPPEVPLTSNTSGLRITDIAARAAHPERTMTTHFWFPAHLVPLVEVVMSEHTDETMAAAVRDELRLWGKQPVLVRKDLPGQLANRILQAVIREAVNIVEEGIATPEDVDLSVKMGMGIRFPAWGPLEHIDAVGLDLASSVQDTVLPEIADRKEAAGLLKKYVKEGKLGHRTGHGFYNWEEKSMDDLADRRNRFIMEAIKLLGC